MGYHSNGIGAMDDMKSHGAYCAFYQYADRMVLDRINERKYNREIHLGILGEILSWIFPNNLLFVMVFLVWFAMLVMAGQWWL